MYLPLEYWKHLIQDPCTLGPRGGRFVGFENAGRSFNSTEFVQLVASGFIGSRLFQSDFIRALISKVIADNKSVTLAVHNVGKPPDEGGISALDDLADDDSFHDESDKEDWE